MKAESCYYIDQQEVQQCNTREGRPKSQSASMIYNTYITRIKRPSADWLYSTEGEGTFDEKCTNQKKNK